MSETAPQPPLMVVVQYVKDLSFEVPNAPLVYGQLRSPPRVDINLDVQARRLNEGSNQYEVVLAVRAEAKEDVPNGESVFVAELAYGGLFTVNVPEEQIEPVVLVECPRILFPFARAILADTSRNGAFPPVMLQPIDFYALWQNRRAQNAADAAAAAPAGNA